MTRKLGMSVGSVSFGAESFNVDTEWLGMELQRDAEYVAWLTVNDPDRIPGYLLACNYNERLEQWKALK